MEPLLVSIAEATKALSIGRTSVYELIRTGQLETRNQWLYIHWHRDGQVVKPERFLSSRSPRRGKKV